MWAALAIAGVILVALLRFVVGPIVRDFKESLDQPTHFEREFESRKTRDEA